MSTSCLWTRSRIAESGCPRQPHVMTWSIPPERKTCSRLSGKFVEEDFHETWRTAGGRCAAMCAAYVSAERTCSTVKSVRRRHGLNLLARSHRFDDGRHIDASCLNAFQESTMCVRAGRQVSPECGTGASDMNNREIIQRISNYDARGRENRALDDSRKTLAKTVNVGWRREWDSNPR